MLLCMLPLSSSWATIRFNDKQCVEINRNNIRGKGTSPALSRYEERSYIPRQKCVWFSPGKKTSYSAGCDGLLWSVGAAAACRGGGVMTVVMMSWWKRSCFPMVGPDAAVSTRSHQCLSVYMCMHHLYTGFYLHKPWNRRSRHDKRLNN